MSITLHVSRELSLPAEAVSETFAIYATFRAMPRRTDSKRTQSEYVEGRENFERPT
jgi:hypothetical protein